MGPTSQASKRPPRLVLDTHLFELGPYHYDQGKAV